MYKTKLAEWKRQEATLKAERKDKANAERYKEAAAFDQRESDITSDIQKAPSAAPSHSLLNSTLNSYWLPSLAPEAKPDLVKKPSRVIQSPFGHPIKVKDLVPLVLTPVPGIDEEDPNHSKTGRYMCPLCAKSLNSVSGVVCIKPTGHVYCSTCMEKILLPEKICPQTGTKFDEDDLLHLKSEGSSYSGRKGDNHVVSVYTPVARIG